MTRWNWRLLQLSRKLWVRATFLGILGLGAALASMVAERYLPWDFPLEISASAVESLLTIIASSMLAVTTFSLSTMLGAFGAATSSVTPRATTLLLEDRLAQNVLSSFVGSFIFSIVGIVILKTGAYGERGRFILFLVTIAVIVMIVTMLLRWINHLLLLGRMGETTGRLEAVAAEALRARVEAPWLGGQRLEVSKPPEGAVLLWADQSGYLQHIDMPALQALAEAAEAEICLPVNPGKYVFAQTVLAWYLPPGAVKLTEGAGAARSAAGSDPEGTAGPRWAKPAASWPEAAIRAAEGAAASRPVLPNPAPVPSGTPPDEAAWRAAFTIGVSRSFDQDPRFGLAVLAEVGSGALTPSRGDGGTAIDILGRLYRLMALWGAGAEARAAAEPLYPLLRVQALRDADLFEDAFLVIGRDGAAMVEVQIRLRKVLAELSALGSAEFRAAARHQAAIAAARAEAALSLPEDRQRLRNCLEP